MGVKVRERKPREWWIYIDHKGQRKAVKVGADAAAKKAAKKIEEGFTAGAVLPGPCQKVLFADRYGKWMRQHVGLTCEESPAHTYAVTWENHVKEHFGNLTSDSIDRDKIREFYMLKTEAGYGKNTIKNMRNLISGVMTFAIEDRRIGVNPASRSG